MRGFRFREFQLSPLEGTLLEGALLEGIFLEGTLLEDTLLEGTLREGTILEARRPRRSPKTDQNPPKAAARNRQFSMGEAGWPKCPVGPGRVGPGRFAFSNTLSTTRASRKNQAFGAVFSRRLLCVATAFHLDLLTPSDSPP